MRKVSGARPWPVCLFAALFLLAAMLRLLVGLLDPFIMMMEIDRVWPGLAQTRDAGIIAANAQFTIACIPVALIWFRAARFARMLVSVMVALRLLLTAMTFGQIPGRGWSLPLHDLALLMSIIAVALLFAPSANLWFALKEGSDAEVFE